MLKKLLSVCVLILSLVMLTACSGSKDKIAEGTWVEFYTAKDGKVRIDNKINILEVKGSVLDSALDGEFEIDIDKQILSNSEDLFGYTLADGVLSFDNETFVLKDSKEYQQLISDGAIVLKYNNKS